MIHSSLEEIATSTMNMFSVETSTLRHVDAGFFLLLSFAIHPE